MVRPAVACLLLSLVASAAVQAQPAGEKQPVTLRVRLPLEGASLTIEGAPIKQGGMTRLFVSPPLDPAQGYTYTVVARWMPNDYSTITRTRVVPVKAGATVDADLRQADEHHPDEIFIRYVPTPQPVVEAMLKLAAVGPKDVVYDLGCGDGRIVVSAVSQFQARRGVGVDLDAERIKESKANARAAGVEDRVEFREGDVLKLKDLGEASVVMLYLSDEVNDRLRPILQKTLKPGARIVSHRFAMGDWKPVETATVKDRDGTPHRLYLWVVGRDGGER